MKGSTPLHRLHLLCSTAIVLGSSSCVESTEDSLVPLAVGGDVGFASVDGFLQPIGDAGGALSDVGPTSDVIHVPPSSCPLGSAEPFPSGSDRWSAAITLRADDPNKTLYFTPVHSLLLQTGEVMLLGLRRGIAGPSSVQSNEAYTFTPGASPEQDGSTQLSPAFWISSYLSDGPFCGGHAPLADGRMLIAGGEGRGQVCDPVTKVCKTATMGLDFAEIFDPETRLWTKLPNMLGGRRWYPTVTALPGGDRLVMSGLYWPEGDVNRSIERFTPDKPQPWTLLSSAAATPSAVDIQGNYTHVFVLPEPIVSEGRDHDVLIMGEEGLTVAFDSRVDAPGSMAERFKPLRHRPTPEGSLSRAIAATSVLLPLRLDGKGRFPPGSTLTIGGSANSNVLRQADVFMPNANTWCPLTRTETPVSCQSDYSPEDYVWCEDSDPLLGSRRHNGSSVLLPDGKVLLLSGQPGSESPTFPAEWGDPRAPEILDPETGLVWQGSKWPDDKLRGYHNVAVLLPDARVLIGGGRTYELKVNPKQHTHSNDERVDVRYYEPPYLSPLRQGGTRPVIGSLSSTVIKYGGSISVDYTDGPITGVALMALGAQTHAFDQNQRHLTPAWSGGQGDSGTIQVSLDTTASWAPEGPYMLFLMKEAQGWQVPSIATIVSVQ